MILLGVEVELGQHRIHHLGANIRMGHLEMDSYIHQVLLIQTHQRMCMQLMLSKQEVTSAKSQMSGILVLILFKTLIFTRMFLIPVFQVIFYFKAFIY